MENKVRNKHYQSEVIKTEWFYVGNSSEKKTAMFTKNVQVNDAMAGRIDNKISWAKHRSDRRSNRKLKNSKIYHFQLEVSRVVVNLVDDENTLSMRLNEIRIDEDLRGIYFGNYKGLLIGIENFYRDQGVIDLESKIKFFRTR